jgi:glycosyltransferase involved in cell wall biosynthesis
MARLSIGMPTRNQARFIGEAIESIRAQSVTDWELVVVDDGSEDETAAAVARPGDARVRYVRRPAEGVAAARNAALERMTAPFWIWVDSDDRVAPGAFEALLGAIGEADAAYGDLQMTDEAGATTARVSMPEYADWKEALRAMIRKGTIPFAGTLFRAASAAGLRFDPAFTNNRDDHDYKLRWLRGKRLVHLPRVTYLWRRHGGSMTFGPHQEANLEGERRALTNALAHYSLEELFGPGLSEAEAREEVRKLFARTASVEEARRHGLLAKG